MTEHMGPLCCNCPARILDLLTPTDSRLANQWRESCRDNIRKLEAVKALEPGIRFRYGNVAYTLESARPWC